MSADTSSNPHDEWYEAENEPGVVERYAEFTLPQVGSVISAVDLASGSLIVLHQGIVNMGAALSAGTHSLIAWHSTRQNFTSITAAAVATEVPIVTVDT